MTRSTIFAAAIIAFAPAASLAQAVARPGVCSLSQTGSAQLSQVARVIDGRTFAMQDGREVRLAGLEPVPDGAETDAARAALTELIVAKLSRSLSRGRWTATDV